MQQWTIRRTYKLLSIAWFIFLFAMSMCCDRLRYDSNSMEFRFVGNAYTSLLLLVFFSSVLLCYWLFMSFPLQVEEFAFDHVLFSTKPIFHFSFYLFIYVILFGCVCLFFFAFTLVVVGWMVSRMTMKKTFMQLLPRILEPAYIVKCER